MNKSLLQEKSKTFALRIVRMCAHLRESKQEDFMSKQLTLCGTTIGANLAKAIYDQSDTDYISQMGIAQMKAAQSKYWIELLHESGYLDDEQFASIYADVEELLKLLTSSTKMQKAQAT